MAREVTALFKTFRTTPLKTFRALYAGCPTAAAASVSPHRPPQLSPQHGYWLRSCPYSPVSSPSTTFTFGLQKCQERSHLLLMLTACLCTAALA